MYEIANTVGIEIEFSSKVYSANELQEDCPRGWRFERDGSCSVHRNVSNRGLPFHFVDPKINLGGMRKQEFGGEFISPPMIFDDPLLKKQLAHIFSSFSGEAPDDHTGIHIHVCTGMPSVEVLRNFFRLGRAAEKGFYRISCGDMRTHRGEENNYKYCRPLSLAGRQAVFDTDNQIRWAYSEDALLKNAKTSLDFLRAFCRADHRPLKWMPARYYWLNFMSIMSLGTLEFRPFNFVPEPATILAWVDLCRAFVLKGMALTPIKDIPIIRFSDFIDVIGDEYFTSEESLGILERQWFKGAFPTPPEPMVNHVCLDYDRRIPLAELGSKLIPSLLSREEIKSLVNYNGNYYNDEEEEYEEEEYEEPEFIGGEEPNV